MSLALLSPVERLGQSRERLRLALQQLSRSPQGAVAMAASATKAALQPLAQRHPLALVIVALVLGALLIGTRPWRWRWLLKPALVAGLLPPLIAKAAAAVPLPAWLEMLSAVTRRGAETPPTPPTAAP